MKQWKRLTVWRFFLLLFFFSFSAVAQSLSYEPPNEHPSAYFDQPPQTELVRSRNVGVDKSLVVREYKYETELSGAEILSFYRSLLSGLGFREAKEEAPPINKDEPVLFFTHGVIEQVMLTVYEPVKSLPDAKRTYYLRFWDLRDILQLASLHFRKPPSRSFAPTPDGVAEGLQVINGKPTEVPNSRVYLSDRNVDSIEEFYLKHMAKDGWNLVNNQPYEGKGNFFNVLSSDPRYKKMFSDFGINVEEFYPGIEITAKGVSLQYERRKETCIITITQFLDPPEVLKNMRIDPQPLERYGATLIAVNKADTSFDQMQAKSREFLNKGRAEFLKRFLGH